jgi:uncharacterized protein YjiS (DUF1127 family)
MAQFTHSYAHTPVGIASARALATRLLEAPGAGLILLHRWQRRVHDRAALAALDGRLLDDVGLSARQARHEIAKPFWRG